MTTAKEVKALPVGALHADDDTECSCPNVCGRMTYWPGGAPTELPD